jgi:glycosyltransferase involved in cell wall biosynthesis
VAAAVPLVPREVVVRLSAGVSEPKPGGPLRVLFVGTVTPRKGAVELLEVAMRLPQVYFRVVGPVPDEKFGRKFSHTAERLPNLAQFGYADWPQLREHYRWANALVLPSHFEGFPRVVYEATAFGAAIVATPVGGLPDRLQDGRDARFVPIGDANALAAAIGSLARHPEDARILASAALRSLAPVFIESDPVSQFDRALRAAIGLPGTPVGTPVRMTS